MTSGSREPKEAVMPRISAKPSAIPTRLIPTPNKVAPAPHSNPNKTTLINVDEEAPEYTCGTFGTVAKLMIQGKISRPDTAKRSQIFSQRHASIRFMGAAKLPFSMPATITTASAHIRCPLIRSPESGAPVLGGERMPHAASTKMNRQGQTRQRKSAERLRNSSS